MAKTLAGEALQELAGVLKPVVALTPEDRIEAMTLATAWWLRFAARGLSDLAAVAKSIRKTYSDHTTMRSFDRAQKARILALSSGAQLAEREAALLVSLRQFEQTFSWLVDCGEEFHVDFYLRYLEVRRGVLERRRAQVEKTYEKVLSWLQRTFPSVTFAVSQDPDADACVFDANRRIIVTAAFLDTLDAATPEFLFATFFPKVCRAMAVQRDAIGGITLNVELALGQATSVAWAALQSFSGVPKEASVRPVKVKNEWFRGRMARIFEILATGPGYCAVAEIRRQVPEALDVTRMLGLIADRGRETGRWELKKYRSGRVEFRFLNDPEKEAK